jgi:hypothetical protein
MTITQDHINDAINIIEEMEGTEDECLTDESVVDFMLFLGLDIPDAHAALDKAQTIYECRKGKYS